MRDALRRLFARLTRNDSDADEPSGDTASTDDGWFVGSLLDASVNRSNGQGDPKAASEMAALQEEASRLAEQDQYRER